jgi:hypothetical protein
VPIISASVSWLIFAMIGSGLPSFPKFASSNRSRARRFSLELKSWSTRSSSTRMVRASRCENVGGSQLDQLTRDARRSASDTT